MISVSEKHTENLPKTYFPYYLAFMFLVISLLSFVIDALWLENSEENRQHALTFFFGGIVLIITNCVANSTALGRLMRKLCWYRVIRPLRNKRGDFSLTADSVGAVLVGYVFVIGIQLVLTNTYLASDVVASYIDHTIMVVCAVALSVLIALSRLREE